MFFIAWLIQDWSHQWSTRPIHSPGWQRFSRDFKKLGQMDNIIMITTSRNWGRSRGSIFGFFYKFMNSTQGDGPGCGWNIKREPGRASHQYGPVVVAQIRRVIPIGPVQDDLLIWRAGFSETFIIVGVVQIAPNAGVTGRNLKSLQATGSHAHVMQFGQNFAINCT